MHKNYIRVVLVFVLVQSIVFSNFLYAEQLLLPSADVKAPEVEHQPATESLQVGVTHQVKARVTDNVAVDTVVLFYRQFGESQYHRKNMLREYQGSETYTITLGNKDLTAPGIEYYIQATDTAGNSVLYGYSFEPIKLSVFSGDSANLPPAADGDTNPFNEVLNGGAEEKKGSYTWLWIALGALAVGAIAASAGGGGDDGGGSQSGKSEEDTTVTVSGPVPNQ